MVEVKKINNKYLLDYAQAYIIQYPFINIDL